MRYTDFLLGFFLGFIGTIAFLGMDILDQRLDHCEELLNEIEARNVYYQQNHQQTPW